MRKFLKKYFPFVLTFFNVYARYKYKDKSTQQVFDSIYASNSWEGDESVSGQGSDLEQTEVVRGELPKIIEKFDIKSILDAPCGDHYWISQVDLKDIKYTGADIVQELIDRTAKKYPEKNFIQLDLVSDSMESYDLVFVRDCFVHLSQENILKALNNIKKSNSTYLLTTTFPEKTKNMDIVTGGWRWLNFQEAPFNFPEPLYVFNEKCTEGKKFTDKSMGLWKISDFPDHEVKA
ncbi:MAG: class I SAM-dependent methyltransferase [Crocinitomicaceae bacterium]|nr:class I SAM-dependent methyltransferase [Crocinitomicaceae bacterium]